ncbi:hypothetical protein JANAI62_28380 [Jannaschia pagri]|uniref:Uncharacterized protein n=1 Tax=Jannaschia pagri TaxID=2829797 RepID=A0ABQ4NP78_9RHOB|nr:hypothetical protein JANAI61_28380 [Jannaschia sp. AI_61]GIT96215.1 hypothetical protein JANAI62_28380 [Jannaschia sp. AI_62]
MPAIVCGCAMGRAMVHIIQAKWRTDKGPAQASVDPWYRSIRLDVGLGPPRGGVQDLNPVDDKAGQMATVWIEGRANAFCGELDHHNAARPAVSTIASLPKQITRAPAPCQR